MKKSINRSKEVNDIYPAIRNHILVHSGNKLTMINVESEEEIF